MNDNKQSEEISIGDDVEVLLNDNRILEGKLVRFAGAQWGFDYDGSPIRSEHGWGVVGKLKNSKEDVADWEIKVGQYKEIIKK